MDSRVERVDGVFGAANASPRQLSRGSTAPPFLNKAARTENVSNRCSISKAQPSKALTPYTHRPTPLTPLPPDTHEQISLAGNARIPDVSLVESAFGFGDVTSGGCESLDVNLVNRGPVPASLHLDLSQYPDFHLEKTKVSVTSPGVARGGEEHNGGRDERCGLQGAWIRFPIVVLEGGGGGGGYITDRWGPRKRSRLCRFQRRKGSEKRVILFLGCHVHFPSVSSFVVVGVVSLFTVCVFCCCEKT